jgi:cellobiose phosphorylase
MNHPYGHFNDNGDEFIITNPATPRAFDNMLWNESMFSNVQQTGVGYCDYQIDGKEGIQLMTGVGRICDFDVFGRDHLMSRLIYIRDNETGKFWNAGWEPVCEEPTAYACRHGLGYTIIESVTNEVKSTLRIFVPVGKDPLELWTLTLSDVSGRGRALSVFVYNQIQFKFKWGFDSYGDMFYRSSHWNKDLNAIVASKHPYRRPHDFLTAFLAADMPIVAFDGVRDAFVGAYNTLKNPRAVAEGKCSNTPGSSDATILAAQFNISLKGDKVIQLILGATDDEGKIAATKKRYFEGMELEFEKLRAEKQKLVQHNRVQTPDEHFNRMVNIWLKQGATFGAAWCRWGWMGYRDIVQHGLGVSALDPARTREILAEAFRHQFRSGFALRGWNPVDEKSYSDSALWLIFTLTAYLKETGDMAFLDERIPFHDDGEATVMGHIEAALNSLENNKGTHGLCLIKFGDWNDSLTAVGRLGRGESVFLSQLYAEALREMRDLADFLEDDVRRKDLESRRARMLAAVNAAWDGSWYTRCFDDSGKPVGSKENEQAQIFLESQAWALICGAADTDRAARLLESCDERLGTPLGYRLLAPTFCRIDDNVGRISSMEPGICENGTVYSHLSVWMMLGLLRYGMADRALDLWRTNITGYFKDENDLRRRVPPYMMANCYYGPDHRNNAFQMEFTWITGSLAWLNVVPTRDMLGVKADYRGLMIEPCLPSEWDEVSVLREYRGGKYDIQITRGAEKGIWLDGVKLGGSVLPILSGTHKVKVGV